MIELVFLHIPKTAGRTLVQHIASQYPRGTCVTVSRDRLRLQQSELRDHLSDNTRVLMGHLHYRDVQEFIGPETKLITFLRHPVDRVLSNYFHDISVEVPKQRAKRPLTLARRRFYNIRRGRSLLQTALVLARRPIQLLEPPPLEQYVEAGHESVMSRFLRGIDLADLWFIGFQERFTADLRLLAFKLGWSILDENLRVNARVRRTNETDPPDEIVTRIRERNRQDLELYRRAAELRGLSLTAAGRVAA